MDRALLEALDHVLDLSPDARAAWLEELRRERPALAAELETLLEGEDELVKRGFLEGDVSTLLAAAPTLAGRRVGAYTLVRPLGEGGMGSVWLAQRSDGSYEAQVAIKLLSPVLIDRVGSQRFRREGNALARLTHPNIARLIDAGVTAGGQPYLVLEHVEGTRIDAYCDEHRLSPVRRLELFRQVLAAVAHAHANLIVHRDLKPSNILVTRDGTVKLLDFGIAKLLETESAAAERTELTEAGGLPFTPEYAAPEQVTGGPITTATDVYALGVLLYLLLSGRHPTGAGELAPAQHLRAVTDTEPVRLSTAMTAAGARPPTELADAAAARGSTVDRLQRLYAGDLDNILAKALQKDPSQRYASVGALAEDLGRYLRNEPVRARPASVGYRVRKFVRRNRGSVLAATLAVGALLVATTVTTMQMIDARRQRDEAQEQRDRAIYQERRATASSDFMEFLLQNIAASGGVYTTRGLLDEARAILESDYRGDPRFVARMMVELSSHYYRLRDRKGQYALLHRADELATQVDDPETIAHANCWLAMTEAFDGEIALARWHLTRADQSLARASDPPLPLQIRCLHARSNLARRLGLVDSALFFARAAVALSAAAGDTASYRHQAVLNELAGALNTAGRFREALGVTRRSLALLQRMGRDSTATMAVEQYNEAIHLWALGESRDADAALSRAMTLAARMDARGRVPTYMATLAGDLANDLERPAVAIAELERALADAREQADTAGQVRALTDLSGVLIEQGYLGEARRHAAELSKLVRGSGRSVLTLLDARTAYARADWPRAHRLFVEYLAARGFPDRPPGVYQYPRVVIQASLAALRSGDPVAADSLALHALRLAHEEEQDDARSGVIGDALVALARARLARHDTAAATALLQRAGPPLAAGYGASHHRTLGALALLDSLAR